MTNVSNIEILITRRCNSRCKYCKIRNPEQMSLGTAGKIVRFIKEKVDAKKVKVMLSGGETLLNFKIATYLIKKLSSIRNKKISIILLTNGILLSPDCVEFLKEYGVSVQISIDGSERMHNTNRPLAKNRGSYELARKGLELLKKNLKSNMIIVNGVIPLDSNISRIYVHEFFDSLMDLNVKQIDFDLDFNKLLTEKKRVKQIYTYAFEWTYAFIKKNKKVPPVQSIKNMFYIINKVNKTGKPLSHICPALARSLNRGFSVDVDGRIYPCIHFFPRYPSGKGYGFGSIDKIETEKHLLFSKSIMCFASIQRNNLCKKCPIKKYCAGPCVGLNYRTSKTFFPKGNIYCGLRKAQMVNALKVYKKVGDKEIFNRIYKKKEE